MRSRAVPEQDMLGLESAERAARREEAQERMDAERLVAREEVGQAPQSVAADEDPLLGEPEGDLTPEPAPHDGQNDERRSRHLCERRDVEWHPEAVGDLRVVALVAVDELYDSRRLAQGADPLVQARAVDDVRQPDASSHPESVRGAL